MSNTVLNPIINQIQNPFYSLVEEMETWLLENDKDYLETEWPKAKYAYLKRILRSKNGSLLRGFSQRCKNPELAASLFDIYKMLDHCIYYTSRYWRAFYYHLKTGKLNHECWPMFGEKDLQIAYSILTKEDLEKYKTEASQEWLDYFEDQNIINKLFKQLKQPIRNLCRKRLKNFLYDPAKYDIDDLEQYAFEAITIAIRKNDYIPKNQDRIIGWSLRCADNALLNQRSLANSDSKRRTIKDDSGYRIRLYSLDYHADYQSLHDDQDIINPLEAKLLDDDMFKLTNEMENTVLVNELISHADEKISSYLKFVCCGEHNPDFWTWFYVNEPTLAQRISYLEENPEAIAPYLQRHLDLPTHQLTDFLRRHLPDVLSKVSKESAIHQLQYHYGD